MSWFQNYPTIFFQYYEDNRVQIQVFAHLSSMAVFLSGITTRLITAMYTRSLVDYQMWYRHHGCLKLVDGSRTFCACEDPLRSLSVWGDATAQVSRSVCFNLAFCKNKFRLRADVVLAQHFTFLRCKWNFKHMTNARLSYRALFSVLPMEWKKACGCQQMMTMRNGKMHSECR